MSKTKIVYRDIAPKAADDVAVTSADATGQSNVSLLPDGVEPKLTISLEPGYWGLNGSFRYAWSQPVAFQSTQMSGADGTFTKKPTITMTFSMRHTSTGLTFVFDKANGGYCTSMTIVWYQGNTKLAEQNFTPDSPKFVCNKTVHHYDRIVVTLNKTSLPHRYARLQHIIFGIYREFGMSDIRAASIVNQTGLISQEIPVSTMKWTLDNRSNIEYMFQFKQPVEVSNDDNLIGVYYIDGYTRTSQSVYDIDCYDAMGVLGENHFDGGYYNKKSTKELLEEIVGGDFDIEYDPDVVDVQRTGIINPCTKREAIQQVLFAWGVCASTDGRSTIRIFNFPSTGKNVSPSQTYEGVSTNVASIVTEVRVTAHKYTAKSDGGYEDTTTVYSVKNPNVGTTDKQNVITVDSATLISTDIGQQTAQWVFDYYMRRNTSNATIVWKGERLGDYLSLPNAWGETSSGNVSKLEIKLSNTVAAGLECVGV